MKRQTRVFDEAHLEEGIAYGAQVIQEGGLVAMPTETVYGLGADAFQVEAVRSIFQAKGRPVDNPLIVHIACTEDVEKLSADIPPAAQQLMNEFWPGPLTIILPKRQEVPYEVSGGLETVAVRFPSHPVARELIARSGRPIAAPSANLSGKPSPTCVQHVIDDMAGKIDVILDGGECQVGLESTVVDCTCQVPLILRPGAITPLMIRQAVGDVAVSPAVLEGVPEGQKAASPGMKYKHYAPKAAVYVVSGENEEEITQKIKLRYDNDIKCGKIVLIICGRHKKSQYGSRNALSYEGEGSMELLAKQLFSVLRQADKNHVDVIYFEEIKDDQLGLAIMNRVIRAAGFHII